MKTILGMLSLFACFWGLDLACQPAQNSTASRAIITEERDGGTVVTKLSYGIEVNKGSSLRRKWFILNDDSCPVQLVGVGINTVYKERGTYSSGEYLFEPEGFVRTSRAISAYEVRFVLIDMFGSHMKTLGTTSVSDLVANGQYRIDAAWHGYENDVAELLTVAAYIARVRLPDGTVWMFDSRAILSQLEKIKAKVSEQQLSPEAAKKGEK